MEDYHLRVQFGYKRLYNSKPAAIWATVGPAQADVMNEGLYDMAKLLTHQLFLAGLCKNLREKVLKAKKNTFFERLYLASELECIQQDHCRNQKIAAVKAKMDLMRPTPLPGRPTSRRRLSRSLPFAPETIASCA
jgi:hypothetical protein